MLNTAKPIQIYLAAVQADNGDACCLSILCKFATSPLSSATSLVTTAVNGKRESWLFLASASIYSAHSYYLLVYSVELRKLLSFCKSANVRLVCVSVCVCAFNSHEIPVI